MNTGRYIIRGNQVLIQMADSFSASIDDANHLDIQNVKYERQQ